MAQRILVADDSITIQKVIGLTFANESFELEMADSGDEALEKALANIPDLVIADTNMPGLSGYDLCARLRAEPRLATVPVILLAGTYEIFDDARAREVGASDHLTKPFESQLLIEKVKALLASGQGSAPAATPVDDGFETGEPEILDADALEDADVMTADLETVTVESTVDLAPTPRPEDFGDVDFAAPTAAASAPATAEGGDWDMGGFDTYLAASSTTPAAGPASTPPAVEIEAGMEAEAVIEPFENSAPEVGWEPPVEELPVAEDGSVWRSPAAAETEVPWDQASAAAEATPAFPEAAPIGAYGEPEAVEPESIAPAEVGFGGDDGLADADVLADPFAEGGRDAAPATADAVGPIEEIEAIEPESIAPAEVGFGGDDGLADADVLADQVAEGGWDAAPATADAVGSAEEPEAVEPTPADLDTADFGAVSGDAPATPAPSDADVFAEFAAYEAAAPGSAGEAVVDDTFGSAAEELPTASEITAEPAAPAAALDIESGPAASVEPDWNAPAWQSDESAVEEEEIVPASAAPVWAEEPVAPPAAAASPEIDLASASERIVAEAREQITARLSAALGSEIGPLVEARVEAALDELLPRLIEKKLKSAVDQALQQAFDDLKRRLG